MKSFPHSNTLIAAAALLASVVATDGMAVCFQTGSATDTGTNVCLRINPDETFIVNSAIAGDCVVAVGQDSVSHGNDVVVEQGAMFFATNTSADSIVLLQRGALFLRGGTAVVDTVVITTNGILRGSGTVFGNITNHTGVLSPGSTNSPGKMVIAGKSVMESESDTEIHIENSGTAGVDYDCLECSGAFVADGKLRVYVSANCNPSNASFTIITSSGGLSGIFNNVSAINRISSADGRGSFAFSISGNSCVLSDWSQQQVPVPGAPVAQPATGTGMTSFYANWDSVLYTTEYLLDVATNSLFGTSDMLAGYNGVSTGTATTYRVTGLAPGARYYYRVRARNESGAGAYSGTITATTPTEAAGTIQIDVTPDTGSWSITLCPSNYSNNTSGTGDLSAVTAPEGTYVVEYGTIEGYNTPSPQTNTVSDGTAVVFTGTYRSTGSSSVNGDFTGDGKTDMMVYDDSTGIWYIRATDGTVVQAGEQWGGPGYTTVLGDYDGDGVNDQAVYHTASGNWYIRSMSGTTILYGEQWGGPGMVPVEGDYDGDGISDMAVYEQTTGTWYIRTIAGTTILYGEQWGGSDLIPVPGDYDGDGTSDIAVYEQTTGTWYIRTIAGTTILYGEQWGGDGYATMTGDYDGDGADDLAVYEQSTGAWYVRSVDGTVILQGEQWGGAGYEPLSGDYTGDGVADLAVYCLDTGKWYIRTIDDQPIVSGEQWGGQDYTPGTGSNTGRPEGLAPVYRLYSYAGPDSTGEHLFTISVTEEQYVADMQTWQYEGVAWYAVIEHSTDATPLYRMYDPVLRVHYYTIDVTDYTARVSGDSHWIGEGAVMYVWATSGSGKAPVYRFYNATLRAYFFTVDETERDTIIDSPQWGYAYEGIAFYAYR